MRVDLASLNAALRNYASYNLPPDFQLYEVDGKALFEVREADGSLKLNSFAFYLHNETFKTCTLVHFPTESSILDALGSAITYFRMNILDKEVSAPSRVS